MTSFPRHPALFLALAAASALPALAGIAPAAAGVAPAGDVPSVGPRAADTGPGHRADQEPGYAELWEAGSDYATFLEEARGRRDLWVRNTDRAEVPPGLLQRARAVPGTWRLLVVAFDRCSDSVSTIPYIAALAARLDGVDLRIIPPELGRPIMEDHRTPDGRAATPTVLLLRDDWTPAGAWVERPAELQAWYTANPDGLSHDQRYDRKMAWYDQDGGASTMREIVELLEAASR
jgi:hypothetical protein